MKKQEHKALQKLPIKVEFQGRIRRFRVSDDDFLIPALAKVLNVTPQQLFVHDGQRIMAMDSIVKDQDSVHRSRSIGRIPRFFALIKPEAKPGGILVDGMNPENLALSLYRIYRTLDDVLVEVKDIKRSMADSNAGSTVSHETAMAGNKLQSEANKELSQDNSSPDQKSETHDSSELVDGSACEVDRQQPQSDDQMSPNHCSSAEIDASRHEMNLQPPQSDAQKVQDHGSFDMVGGRRCEVDNSYYQSNVQVTALEEASASSVSNGDGPDALDSGGASLQVSSDLNQSTLLSTDDREFIYANISSNQNLDDLDDKHIDRMADVMSETSLSDDFSRLSDPKSDNLVDSFVVIRRQALQQSQLERIQSLTANIKLVEAEHGDVLERLAAMGYSNSKLSASVLMAHNYDFQETVEALERICSMSMNM